MTGSGDSFTNQQPPREIIVSAPSAIPGCVLRGTRIDTERGEIPIEVLRPGDKVRTLSGDFRSILWIGHQSGSSEPPVIFEPDALAEGYPTRKVAFSPRQTVFVDTLLIPVELLLNGVSIRSDKIGGSSEYFRIELETPDIIFAENLPIEVSCGGNREIFDNFANFRANCPDRAPVVPLEHFRPVTDGLMLAGLQLRTGRRAGDLLHAIQKRRYENRTEQPLPKAETSAKTTAEHIAQLRGFLDKLRQKEAPDEAYSSPSRRALILSRSHYGEAPQQSPHLNALQQLGFALSVFPVFLQEPENAPSCTVEDKLCAERNRFDLIYFDGEQTAAFYIALARHYQPRAHIMMAAERLLFPVLDKRATQEKKPALQRQALVMRLRECAIASQTDSILLTEAADGAILKQLVPTARVFSLPQPFRASASGQEIGLRTGIVLQGAGGAGISLEQARWFVDTIMPRVWKTFPDMPCRILASGPQDTFAALPRDHVEIFSNDDERAKALSQSLLCVIPDLDPRHLNNGLLNALAQGIACIMTPVLADETGVPEGMRDLLVAADDDAFVTRITHLYTNDLARGAASFWGLKHVRDAYGSGRVKRVFAEILGLNSDAPHQ